MSGRAARAAKLARRAGRSAAPAGRPVAARTARNEAREGQARDLANRFIAGERRLATYVAPAPAAAFDLPASVGRPLPGTLIEALEQGFGADLGALRVHSDAPAAAAARDLGAKAFASGAHLVFGEGYYRPETEAGRRLIAHEVVHSLQQSGRATHHGRIRVSDVAGTGLPQCDSLPAFAVLRAAHAPASKSKGSTRYEEVASALAAVMKSPDPKAALAKYAGASLLEIAKLKWPREAESLLYDSCKQQGLYDLAAQLIERDKFEGGKRIRTVGYTQGATDALEKRNGGWAVYAQAVAKVGFLQRYEAKWLAEIERFLMGGFDAGTDHLPSEAAEATKGATIAEHREEVRQQLLDASGVGENEWIFGGLLLLADLDTLRVNDFIGIFNQIAKDRKAKVAGILPGRTARAAAIASWGAKLPKQATRLAKIGELPNAAAIHKALHPYLKALGGRVATLANKALALWEEASSLLVLLKAKGDKESAKVLIARRRLVGRIGARIGLPALLAKLLDELNRGDAKGERLPSPAQFDARAKIWADKLLVFSENVIGPGRLAAFRDGDDQEALAWIALDHFVLLTREYLENWRPDKAKAVPAALQAAAKSDEVAFARIELADWIHDKADPLGWAEAEDAAKTILEAELEAQSILAIRRADNGSMFTQSWMTASSIVDQARDDFGDQRIRNWEPLTMEAIALFLRTLYLKDFAKQLRIVTPASDSAEQKAIDDGAVPYLAAQAQRQIQAELPERWYAEKAHFAKKAGDPRSFSQVLRDHWAYAELVADHRPPGFTDVVPVGPGEVFAWFVPILEGLVSIIRPSPLFQGLVATVFVGREPADALAAQKALDETPWFRYLQQTLTTKLKDDDFRKKEWPAIAREVFARTLVKHDAAVEEFRNAFVASVRRDRRLIAERLIPLLEDHSNFLAIRQAMKELRSFEGAIEPLDSERLEMQIALLLLEVAPELRDAVIYERGFDVVFALLGYTEPAVIQAGKLASLSKEQRRPLLPDHENDDGWIAARTKLLVGANDFLKAVRGQVQKISGFKADQANQQIISQVKMSSALKLPQQFDPRDRLVSPASSKQYRVIKVLQTFIFHPAYGSEPSAYEPDARSGYAPMQFLKPDGFTPIGPKEALLEVEVVVAVGGFTPGVPPKWTVVDTLTLTPQHREEFEGLHKGVGWLGFGSAMQNLESAMMTVLEIALDAGELVPGFGLGITAARVSATLMDFFQKGDFDALVDAFGMDMIGLVEGLYDLITEQLDEDHLILFLLFGDSRLDRLLAGDLKPVAKAPKKARRVGKLAGLGKAVRNLKGLGRRIIEALKKLEGQVHGPMRDLRVFGASRPLLSFALNYGAERIHTIEVATERISFLIQALDGRTGGKEAKSRLGAEQEGLGQRIHQVLQALEAFKLPHTIVDMAPILSAVFAVVEDLVLRSTVYGKAAKIALDRSGATQMINDRFATAIVESGFDPNIYWRDSILPLLEKRFDLARQDLVLQLNKVLQSKVFENAFEVVPKPPGMKVVADPAEIFEDDSATDEPDTNPQPSFDRPLIPRPEAVPQVDAGAALPRHLRVRMERSLGQDFSHVRLHSGEVGERMTEAFGADALTSGSHVFVRRGKVADTIGHELVHVVQQTGPRPLGASHSSAPVAGHPERGLDWRPASETEADAVANALRRGQARPPGPAARGEFGLQPTGVSLFTIARLMREMADLDEVKKNAEHVEGMAAVGLPKDVAGAVEMVLAALKTPDTDVWRVPKPFSSVVGEVKKRLSDESFAQAIARAAHKLAAAAIETGGAKAGTPTFLAPGHFARQLEGYVLATTGLVVGIDLRTTSVSVSGKKGLGATKRGVDLAAPVKRLSLIHIHLPFMHGQVKFWELAIDATWSQPTIDKTRLRRVLKPLLASKGIFPGIWPTFGDKFRFSSALEKEVEDRLKQGKTLTPEQVPKWEDYVDTSMNAPGNPAIGLRLATYGHKSQKNAPERQSHHLTQYLVPQFFANMNARKAFDPKRSYPGVTSASGALSTEPIGATVGAIASQDGGGGKQIQVAASESKHGETMPAISLAAVTHQQGRLHVTPEIDDEMGKASQGAALHKEFRRHLPLEVTAPQPVYDDYLQKHGRDFVAGKIFSAAQKTYTTVEHHMSTQLASALPKLEYEYYCGLVEGTDKDIADKSGSSQLSAAQIKFREKLKKIPAVAKAHNHAEMVKFGWGEK